MSFRHQRYGGSITKSPVKIGKLVLLCPTEQIENSSEEPGTKASVYAAAKNAVIRVIKIKDDAEELNGIEAAEELNVIKASEVEAVTKKVVKRMINIEDGSEEESGEEVCADGYTRGSADAAAEDRCPVSAQSGPHHG